MEYIKVPPITSMDGAYCIKGYNVVVTGGNRGLGAGISTAYAQSGANVAIVCRNKASGDAMVKELEQYGGRHTCIACDVSKLEEVKAAAAAIYDFFDHIDVLVNNAGVDSPAQFLDEDGLSEFCRLLDVNLVGPASMIHALAPKMCADGLGGSIINISFLPSLSLIIHSYLKFLLFNFITLI